MIKYRLQFLCLSIIIFTMMPANAQYHKKLKKMAEVNHLIGMSLVVINNGEIKDVFHYGKANIERNIKVDNSTMFRIASISKTVTATALMKLYEQNLFKLDDDISNYLGYKVSNPNFPDKAITFRMLLTHTSSLLDGDAYDKFLAASYNQNPPPALKQLLTADGEFYNKEIWNNKTPGTYFTYCNLNFGILGTLIEKIDGKRFDIFIKENISEPLGISGSFNVCDIKNINKLATLYRNSEPTVDDKKGISPTQRDLSQYKIGDNGIIYGPQGGFRVSALDLSKYMLMHMNGGVINDVKILDTATIALMHSLQWKFNGNNGDNYHNLFNAWGLGFHLITNSKNGDIIFDSAEMLGHSGDAYGLISSMFFDKCGKFGFVFICNGYSGEKEFTNGVNSAFYKPEVEVFKLIEKYEYKAFKKENGRMK